MNIQLQKLELIEMLLEVQKESVLEDIRKIIFSDKSNQENLIIKELLDYSEQEYKDGQTELFEDILRESKEKYFSK